ncbi:MAG: efflux RND transporter permease subunit [Kangiellaceae bacterium]|nr:efflux RND transporter permease subunit [Kangiellaceae bacterium]
MVREYDTHKGIIAWFARNSVAANLLMIFILAIGLFSALKIRQQFFPDVVLDMISIQMPYPGAAPEEVEEGIIIKIEESIKQIEGIKRYFSTAREGSAFIRIEIEDGYDVGKVLDEVNIRVDSINSFPASAEKPLIYELRNTREIMWLSLYGDADEKSLKALATEIKNELVAIPDISNAEVVGARPYEIAVEVSDYRLREYGLTLNQVATAIRNYSLDLPSGSIKTEGGDLLVRTKEQAYTGSDFEEIPVTTLADGTRLMLRDIATVKDGFVESEYISRFDGKDAISVRILSALESDDIKAAQAVYRYMEQKRPLLPSNIQVDAWADTTKYLSQRLDLMQRNMIAGALLVFLVLALFLRFKLAFWVMIGIPICFLGSFALMYMYPGFAMTINMITLFGFILVLGIVVDDAIIIAESAWASIEEKGHSVDSVIEGAKRVALPATFGVLTTIAAFYPMMAISGPGSQIWMSIGLVVMFCLIFSLIESKLILPAHLAHMKLNKPEDSKNPIIRKGKLFFAGIRRKVSELLKRFIENKYKPLLTKAINFRGLTVLIFTCALLVVTVGFVKIGWVKTIFFPEIPSDFIRVTATMTEGSTIKQTFNTLDVLEDTLEQLNSDIEKEYGRDVVAHTVEWTNDNASANMFVQLEPSETLPISQVDIMNRWREIVDTRPSVKEFDFNGGGGGGPGGDGVGFRLVGNNMEEMKLATDELKAHLATYEGVYDISDSFSGGKEEVILRLKPEAQNMGITLRDLSSQVRNAFFGAEAQRVQRDSEEIRVYVRYPLEERRSLANLENMPVRTPTGDYVSFSDIAYYELAEGYGRISRIDGVRAISIGADVNEDAGISAQSIIQDTRSNFMPKMLQKYPDIKSELGGGSQSRQDLNNDLFMGAIVSLILIFALMAIPLKSYSKPLLVMSAIPFGIIGAIIGHLILGLPLSILSFFGIIALSGVVVNDSLLMVDFINRARADGASRIDAAINAGTRRFRAVILTSLTTFFGLLPITFETSFQAKIVIPMAVSLAFGILFATLITLIWIPCLYVLLGNARDWFLNRDAKTLAKQQEAIEKA